MNKCAVCNGTLYDEDELHAHEDAESCVVELKAEIERLRAENETLSLNWSSDVKIAADAIRERDAARRLLLEAMVIRHFNDMETDPDSDQDHPQSPYHYDKFLQRCAEVMGERVYSSWPKPGERATAEAGEV